MIPIMRSKLLTGRYNGRFPLIEFSLSYYEALLRNTFQFPNTDMLSLVLVTGVSLSRQAV